MIEKPGVLFLCVHNAGDTVRRVRDDVRDHVTRLLVELDILTDS